MVRVRFAPSPTGYLHIGGLRSALFNLLYARHNNGAFLLRIEDTDRDRFNPEHTKAIVDGLSWAGITPDEPLVFQFARQEEHRKVMLSLIEQKKAYYCFCSEEALEAKRQAAEAAKVTYVYDGTCRDVLVSADDITSRPHVVRFKVELTTEALEFTDLIRGQVTFLKEHIDDFVIMRTDGNFTYNFVVVVDDEFMRITHVLRGEEHLVNTPKQILLHQACGNTVPQFGHLPLILSTTGQKLSKRDAAVSVTDYQVQGILPQALINYLARLGWSHGDQEIFSFDELVSYFSLDGVGKKGAVFDMQKLLWTNSCYIKAMNAQQILASLHKEIQSDITRDCATWSAVQIEQAVMLFKDRVDTLVQLRDQILQLYSTPSYDGKQDVIQDVAAHAQTIQQLLEQCTWNKETVLAALQNFAKESGLKFPQLAKPLRYALSGFVDGASVVDMMMIVGQQETIRRVKLSMQ